jgi:hypothetical protein
MTKSTNFKKFKLWVPMRFVVRLIGHPAVCALFSATIAPIWNFQHKSIDGSGSLYRKSISPIIFDRKAIWPKHHLTEHHFWPNAIWPKVHLTESPFNRKPFDRKFILPKEVIWPKTKFVKRSFDRIFLENGYLIENLTWKTSQMTEMTYDPEYIWPKAFLKNGHLTERSFDRKVIWPKVSMTKSFSEKWSFDRKVIWPNAFFRKMVIWPQKF